MAAINGVNNPDALKGQDEKEEFNTKDMMPDIGLVSLDKLSIAVWSTERKKILESMGLFHIEDILKEYE